ncbi:hypothetical protein BJY01DRAFT_217249 [Aspergillus pseudoustus]|uniref:Uncharacterized protein n=1 Tax=Aspergillus pseudoustus TaxID=1810923 RepID=A0ABR4JRK9_9EURO
MIWKGTPTPGILGNPAAATAAASPGATGILGFFGFFGFVSSPGCFRGRPRFFGV